MVVKVDLDNDLIINHLRNKQWNKLTQYFNSQFTISISNTTQKPIPLSVTVSTSFILESVLDYMRNSFINDDDEEKCNFLTAIFRALRNCCVDNSSFQSLITESPYHILQTTNYLLEELLEFSSKTTDHTVKMILEFLINLVVQNNNNNENVWHLFRRQVVKAFENPRFAYQAAAFLYNIFKFKPMLIFNCLYLYENVVDTYKISMSTNCPNDYFVFLLTLFIRTFHFGQVYSKFIPENRLTVLSFVISSLEEKDEMFSLESVAVNYLIEQFNQKSDCILKTVTSYLDDIEPKEVYLMLELLAKLSADKSYLDTLQSDKSLLINCVFLLRAVHEAGKESQNRFTPIQKLSEVTASDGVLSKDPSFGFKVNLIRLLGNLCWRHKGNQDEMRELSGIPVLLDCCNIDAKNPFIIQWCVLAVRNLCERNSDNQKVIAGMNRQGVVDSSLLDEMGLTLCDDGTSKIGVVPLDVLRK